MCKSGLRERDLGWRLAACGNCQHMDYNFKVYELDEINIKGLN